MCQHDIAVASDEACRLYFERTLPDDRSSTGLREAMLEASKAAIKEKKSEYDKYLAIANPRHGPNFLAEVLPNSTSLYFTCIEFGNASYIPQFVFR